MVQFRQDNKLKSNNERKKALLIFIASISVSSNIQHKLIKIFKVWTQRECVIIVQIPAYSLIPGNVERDFTKLLQTSATLSSEVSKAWSRASEDLKVPLCTRH